MSTTFFFITSAQNIGCANAHPCTLGFFAPDAADMLSKRSAYSYTFRAHAKRQKHVDFNATKPTYVVCPIH